jgi:hypothetical protein
MFRPSWPFSGVLGKVAAFAAMQCSDVWVDIQLTVRLVIPEVRNRQAQLPG